MNRIGITLTGADERTPLADLADLARQGAEIALLYTYAPEGRHRYPCLPWIESALRMLGGKAALHVCGGRGRAILRQGHLGYVLGWVGRVQVNGRLEPAELESICAALPMHTIITQHTEANARLVDVDAPNHALLVDASGGRGLAPKAWQRPATDKPVGFAGGLGPTTLRKQLPLIAAVAESQPSEWWIDMESRLRDTEDWFSVERARAALYVWQEWRQTQQMRKAGA